jgi:hypothetical protein
MAMKVRKAPYGTVYRQVTNTGVWGSKEYVKVGNQYYPVGQTATKNVTAVQRKKRNVGGWF